MDLPLTQLSKILSSAKRVLITGSENPNVDVISTAMAWGLFLTKQKKQVDLVFDGQIAKLKFLPTSLSINKELSNLSKFRIILDISKTKVKQLSYDLKDNQLEINIVPDNGSFSSEDVKTEKGNYKYDLVICLGASSLEALGNVFNEHRHFFHQTPIINLDKSVLNENYGQLNIIEASATSLAEISYQVLQKYLDQEMATVLLAGMISATNSFQSSQVTPETLELASQLIIAGADRDMIIDTLYRTKNINTLKNWGRVLSRLSKEGNIIVSFLKHDEFDNLPQDFKEMVKDLILSTPGAQVACIFYQVELNKTEVWLYTIDNINALELTKDLEATGYKSFVKIVLEKDLNSSKELILEVLKKRLSIINNGS